MVLVGAIQQIICCNADFSHFLLVDIYVRTHRETQQCVARRASLCIVSLVIMVLRQIILQTEGCIGIVQCEVSMMRQLILQLRCPARGWRHRQILRFLWLIQLLGIYIRKSVLEMDAVNGVEVDSSLETQQSGIALRIFIGAQSFLHYHINAL